jgi:hypothetical protein
LGRGLKFFSLLPMLTKPTLLRQITVSRNFGNEVSEKETVVIKYGPDTAKNPPLTTDH